MIACSMIASPILSVTLRSAELVLLAASQKWQKRRAAMSVGFPERAALCAVRRWLPAKNQLPPQFAASLQFHNVTCSPSFIPSRSLLERSVEPDYTSNGPTVCVSVAPSLNGAHDNGLLCAVAGAHRCPAGKPSQPGGTISRFYDARYRLAWQMLMVVTPKSARQNAPDREKPRRPLSLTMCAALFVGSTTGGSSSWPLSSWSSSSSSSSSLGSRGGEMLTSVQLADQVGKRSPGCAVSCRLLSRCWDVRDDIKLTRASAASRPLRTSARRASVSLCSSQ